MRLGIMQPYFFPYIGYWQLINAVDKYVIFDDVNYINRGWINRNRILIDKKAGMINLKLQGASQNKLINEIEILDDPAESKKILKTLESCYRRAPYYNTAIQLIESIISHEEKNLAKYLINSIKQICRYASIETEILVSSSIKKDNSLKGQDKILEICRLLEADEYINAIGGRMLYSHDAFEANNISLKFLQPLISPYKQFGNEFVPGLSIIDVMMFNPPEKIKAMLGEYELVD